MTEKRVLQEARLIFSVGPAVGEHAAWMPPVSTAAEKINIIQLVKYLLG
jgi:hypothetical protein